MQYSSIRQPRRLAVVALFGLTILGSYSLGREWAVAFGCVYHVKCEYRHQPDAPGHGGGGDGPLKADATSVSSTSAGTGSLGASGGGHFALAGTGIAMLVGSAPVLPVSGG
jgi:hypothetical protein